MNIETQIQTKMIEDTTGQYCICLDKNDLHYGWLFYRHPDDRWVTKRRALPDEMLDGRIRLAVLEEEMGIPQRGC